MMSFSSGGWSFIKLAWKVQSRPMLELKHSRVRMITDFRFNLCSSTCEGVATSTSDLTIFACGSNWSVASLEPGFNAAGLVIV
jgi:hypothetical protein